MIKNTQSQIFDIPVTSYIFKRKPNWVVCFQGELMIACAAYRYISESVAYMSDFGVIDSYRRCGIGRLLFEKVKENVGSAQFVWQVEKNNSAVINFYVACGAVVIDTLTERKIIPSWEKNHVLLKARVD